MEKLWLGADATDPDRLASSLGDAVFNNSDNVIVVVDNYRSAATP